MKGYFKTSPIKEHYVECADCSEMFVIHWPTQKQAIKSAREEGWRIRNGFWRCPEHAIKTTERNTE